ncbi:MAG: alpha/beta hydrolase [Acidimicrobiia bacterium]
MDETISSNGLRLGAHFAHPPVARPVPGVVLCHGFPRGPRGAATSAATYSVLADRIARDVGWGALAFNLRGTGTSEGDFSVGGWLDDLRAAVGALAERADNTGVWIVGVSEGGALALCEAADDDRVRGVATLGAPISLGAWAREPTRLLAHARRVGMVRTPGFPPDTGAWGSEAATLDAVAAARRLAPRPLLVLHGTDDESVGTDAARALYEAAGPTAQLRMVHAAGHRLRHDPRAVAVLLGWLERQRP